LVFHCVVRPVVKLISTILLLVLTAVPVTYLFVFQAHQHSIRQRMEERLENEMLHTLVIPKNELRWVKPGKEIILGENMFDIKTMTDQGNGMLLVTGIYDYEETSLVLQMNKSQDQENSKGNKLVQLVQLMVTIPAPDPNEHFFFSRSLNDWSQKNTPGLSSSFKNILTPPPQA
jgi:hypothetical protein